MSCGLCGEKKGKKEREKKGKKKRGEITKEVPRGSNNNS
jgi:hypothetical protein